MFDLVVSNAIIVAEAGIIHGSVGVKDGKFAAIVGNDCPIGSTKNTVDATGKYLMPGAVDSHVHVEAPNGHFVVGDFKTESRAAASGGVTTFVEHPITDPPNFSKELTLMRVSHAERDCYVDFAFVGAAGYDRLDCIAENGSCGIVAYKTFLSKAPPGREPEFEGLTMTDSYEIMKGYEVLSKMGLPHLVHCEDPQLNAGLTNEFRAAGRIADMDFPLTRPPVSEVLAVEKMLRFAKEYGVTLYLVHLSTPEAIGVAKRWRNQEGVRIIIETCPRCLFTCNDDYEKFGVFVKSSPPIRSREMMEQMWEYIVDGTVDVIGTDHTPHSYARKTLKGSDIHAAPPGVTGLETLVPQMLNAVNEGRLSLERAINLISTNPCKLLNIYPQKGAIRIGSDADMIIVDMDEEYVLDSKKFFTAGADSSFHYDGKKIKGRVKTTFVRGEVVYDNGTITGQPGFGTWVKPNR